MIQRVLARRIFDFVVTQSGNPCRPLRDFTGSVREVVPVAMAITDPHPSKTQAGGRVSLIVPRAYLSGCAGSACGPWLKLRMKILTARKFA